MLLPDIDLPANVLVHSIDGVGVLTLNRPAVLNALDLATVRALTRQLSAWAGDPAIRAVLLRGTGERAFCAVGAHAHELPSLLSAPVLAAVARHFGQPGVREILASLAGETDPALRPWVERTLGLLEKRSPLMLCVTFEQLQRGHRLGLEDCVRMERTMMAHCFAHGDTMEGIRALLVDKDLAPRWRHRSVAEVGRGEVAAFFA
jgi:enoyl-CoA hydratase/carnithine racemase